MSEPADRRRLDPRNGAARRSYRFSQAIDVRHDLARHWDLVRKTWRTEIVLHVDYDQRGVASLDCIVGKQLAHAAHDAILDRRGRDIVVHDKPLFRSDANFNLTQTRLFSFARRQEIRCRVT